MDFEHLSSFVFTLSFTLIVQLYVRQIFFHAVCVVDGMLIVFPVNTDVEVGSDVRLNCTTSISKPVNWQYGKDPARMADVYIGGEGLVRPYSKSGRHSMDEDSATGRYDLIIKSVSKEDEGVYVCSEKASLDNPPQARLTVTGADLPKPSCLIYEMFKVGAEAKLNFSTCTHRPFYMDHVPVGKSHADYLYYNGQLLNDYAKSGRFRIEDVSGSCALYITNVQTSDAGTYTCREYSGLGQRHDKDLIVREGTCDNTSDVFSRPGSNKSLEGNCTVSFVGHRETLITWIKLNCNGSLCSGENITSINPQTCTLQIPSVENSVLLQCEILYKNDQAGKSARHPESHNWNFSLVVGITVITILVALVPFLVVCCKRQRNGNNCCTSGNDTQPEVRVPLQDS